MSRFQPEDPNFADRVRRSFDRQRAMATFGAQLTRVEPGEVDIEMPFDERLTQQHGFLHAAVITAILDSASGYAAFTLMPADAAVLSVEFKVNLLAPAAGERFLARATVLRPGRTLTVCRADAFADGRKLVATLQATIMTILDRPGIEG